MSVLISGVLKDGTGKPVQGCTIVLKAKRTTDTVIVNTLASENPDEAGRYSMNVEPGRYAVSLFIEGYPPSYAGDITVYADSPPGTLNYFLGAVSEDDLRPDILKRFEDIAAEINRIAEGVRGDSEQIQQAAHDAAAAADDAKKAAGDSAESERNAQRHAQNAEKKAAQTGQNAAAAASARNDAERFASEARKNAEATASDREATKQDARDAEEAAESVRGFIDAHQAVSTRYSVTDLNGYLASLKISGGACHGLYRYLTASGGINWYFLFLAMYESEGKVFTLADRKTVCEKAITLGIFVPFQTNSSYISGQRIAVGNKLFYVNISGISGDSVPDVSTVSRGDFVRTGTLVLECLGNTVKEIPESWQWFFVDIDSSLRYPVAPDSTDSYAALWLACIATFADKAWLLEPSGVAGYSRWDVICRVADNNLVSQTGPHNLTRVFQNNRAPGGNQYELYFCQDNAEVYAGLRGLVSLCQLLDDAEAKERYTAALNKIRNGILSLFEPSACRFRTYWGEADYPEQASWQRFVQKDRFSVAPWRFGVLSTHDEIETYGRAVLDALNKSYPELYQNYAGIDEFALSDFFAWAGKVTGSEGAVNVAIKRVQMRRTARVTISDVVSAISVASWGRTPELQVGDFVRINGRSVIGGGDIEFFTHDIRHVTPVDNAQIVVNDLNDNTVLFVDNDSSLSYIQFNLVSGAADGGRLSIAAKNDIARVSFISRGVQIPDVPAQLSSGSSVNFVYNATTKMWYREAVPQILSSKTNLLKKQSDALFVDGAHPVIPKVAIKSLSSNLDTFRSLPDGSRVYALTLEIANPLKKGVVGGIGVFMSALIEPGYLYMDQERRYVPAQYFVNAVSATDSTVTVDVCAVMQGAPWYALNMKTLDEEANAEGGVLPCKLLVKLIVGTTLSQNGMS